MSNALPSYRIFQAGDNALMVDYGNLIDPVINQEVIARFNSFKKFPVPGVIEVVPAYSSLLFYYDVIAVRPAYPGNATASDSLREAISKRLAMAVEQADDRPRYLKVPVCYEAPYAPDMPGMTRATGLSAQEIIELHTSTTYQVYMLGFLPGFAYLGEVDRAIAIARKPQPVYVEGGSVGIAGIQTGIYSIHSPGGWNIIGRTPWRLFDTGKEPPALLQAGDSVAFYSITADEFARY